MSRFSAAERRILAVSLAGHFYAHFYMIAQAVLALKVAPDFERRFGYTTGETLGLTMASYALFGLGSFPAGLVTDRWRARWMLVLCLVGSGACTVLAGLASGPAALLAALAGVGLSASIYHPAGLALISRHVRARGWALGLNGMGGNLGLAAAPFAAALLADLAGWRAAFVLLGLPGVASGLVCVRLARAIDEPPAPRVPPPPETGTNYKLYFFLLCAGLVFGGLGYRTTMTSAPALFVEHVTVLRAPVERFMAGLGLVDWQGRLAPGSIMMSAALLLGCTGHLVGGHLADRHDLRLMYLLFHAAAVPLAFLCAVLHELVLFSTFAGLFFFTLGMQSIENSLLSRLTPERWRSTAFGLKFVLTFGIGALGVHLTGRVIDASRSAAPVFIYVGAFTAVVAGIALTLYLVSRRALPRLGQER